MQENEQMALVHQLLARLQTLGVLPDLMLVGSWPLYWYRSYFGADPRLPALRTQDLDFLVPHPPRFRAQADLAQELQTMGFDWFADRLNHTERYVHPALEIEFLFSERGAGKQEAYAIEALNVRAQGLRYMDLLLKYPLYIAMQNVEVKVPEPAAFVWHKLLIRDRRPPAKAQKDLEQVQGLSALLVERPAEQARLTHILRNSPAKWQQKLKTVCRSAAPELLPYFD